MVGRKIGNYTIKRLLGEGGMGSVYEAVQEPIGRRVAVKLLRPEYAHQPDVVKRFFNEARATNLIDHPSIVQVSDYGHLPDGTAYLVMELLAGQSLSDHIVATGGKLPEPLVQHLVWQLASALEAAHARDIIHRDLKPSNIMLVSDPVMPCGLRVKLLDFGIAKLGAQVTHSPKRTRTGLVMGTPLYMAPEQCLGAATVSSKADVYSMGVLFFEMLTGQTPFSAESDLAVLNMHVTKAPQSVQDYVQGVSQGTATLIANMLAKDPQKRPSMAEVTHLLKLLGSSLSREHETLIISKHRKALSASAEQQHRGSSDGNRLPSGVGQQLDMQRRRRLWSLGVSGGLVVLVSGWIALSAVRSHHQPRQLSVQGNENILPIGGTPLSPSPPIPAMVHISIDSTPSGADVIDAEAEKKIGLTPLSMSLDSHDKNLWIILRKESYSDRLIRVNLLHDSKRSEMLTRAPSAGRKPTMREGARDPRKKFEKKTPEEVVEDFKKKLESTPELTGHADLPYKPRIVD